MKSKSIPTQAIGNRTPVAITGRQFLQRGATKSATASPPQRTALETPATHWLGYTDKTHLRGFKILSF